MNYSILYYIVFTVCFLIVQLYWNGWRKKGVRTTTVLSSLIFAVPVWLAILLYTVLNDSNWIFTKEYNVYLWAWILFSVASNLIGVTIIRYISLTEVMSFQTFFKAFIGILVDVFLLKINFLPIAYLGLTLLSLGGFLISKSQNVKNDNQKAKPNIILSAIIVFFITAFGASGAFFLKKALLVQPSLLFHTSLGQSFLLGILGVLGFKNLVRCIKTKIIPHRDIIVISFLIVVGCCFEAMAVKSLPISVFLLISVLKIAIIYLNDVRRKDIKISYISNLAVLMIFCGIAIFSFK